MTIQGFWGLRVEPNKKYSQHVKALFHVTMASLADVINDDNRTSICVEQQLLHIFFVRGEYVIFLVNGKNTDHLTGNYAYSSPHELDTTNTILKSIPKNIGKEKEPTKGYAIEDGKNNSNMKKRSLLSCRRVKLEKEEEERKKQVLYKQEQQSRKQHKHSLREQESNILCLSRKIIVKDIELGTGPGCKNGQIIKIKVTGMLINGKVFTEENEPVSFELGKGIVLKDWDLGIVGMRAGGKRKLTIPPSLGHGKQGLTPYIPRDSTLIFHVHLISIE